MSRDALRARPSVATAGQGASMTIMQAQCDVRGVYVHGGPGQVVSGVVWLVAAALATSVSPAAGIVALLAGGVLILPVTTAVLWLRGGPTALPRGHPMAALAVQIAFTAPLGLLVAVAAAGYRQEWFFPASLIIVGAHYLPFTFLYGLRLFTALAGVLVLAGVTFALWLPASFAVGGWFGGVALVLAGAALWTSAAGQGPT